MQAQSAFIFALNKKLLAFAKCINMRSMITKQQLLDYLGGTHSNVARKLGYKGPRPDNNIIKLDDVLTTKQADAVILRMRAKRIKVPKHWIDE